MPTRRMTTSTRAARLRMSLSLLPELAHLSLQLTHPTIGLRGAAELLRREEGADLERGLSAVTQDLLSDGCDLLQLGLQIGDVYGAGREELAGQIIFGLPELLMERSRCRPAGGDQIPHLRVLFGREVGRPEH